MSAGTGSDMARFNPGERCVFKCQTCSELTMNATEQQLRIAGWRIWRGETVGGSEASVVLCAVCAGNAGTVRDDGEIEGWDATCHTCGAQATDEDWDDPLSEREAQDWCRDHHCEPDTEVIRPKAADRPSGLKVRPVQSVPAKAAYV